MKQPNLGAMALSLHCMLQISCSKIHTCCATTADIITMPGTATGIKVIKVQDQAHLPAQDAVWVLEQAPADQRRSTRRFALRWLPTSLPPPLLDYGDIPERAARARAFVPRAYVPRAFGQRHQCRPRQTAVAQTNLSSCRAFLLDAPRKLPFCECTRTKRYSISAPRAPLIVLCFGNVAGVASLRVVHVWYYMCVVQR
jgi:hypothetical protein